MSIGDIKALEGSDGDAAPAEGAGAGDTPAEESQSKSAPLIHPAKLIDLQKDLPVKLPKEREVGLPLFLRWLRTLSGMASSE